MNNWRAPAEMKAELMPLFDGCMRGRTMYVVPFSMGPVGGAITQLGIEITDSPYAVLSMRIMTRMGQAALDGIVPGCTWVRTVHSVGAPLAEGEEDVAWPCNDKKYIMHFPDTLEVWSLRLRLWRQRAAVEEVFRTANRERDGKERGLACRAHAPAEAHQIATQVRPTTSRQRFRLHAAKRISPCCNRRFRAGELRRSAMTSRGCDRAMTDGCTRLTQRRAFSASHPALVNRPTLSAMETLWGNTIFTNVALTDDGDVWWEGKTDAVPAHLIDWEGMKP